MSHQIQKLTIIFLWNSIIVFLLGNISEGKRTHTLDYFAASEQIYWSIGCCENQTTYPCLRRGV